LAKIIFVYTVKSITKNVIPDEHPEKPPDKDTASIKCSKRGHEFRYDPGWKKASNVIGCPKCGVVIRVRKPET
jgi:hypothetical protein